MLLSLARAVALPAILSALLAQPAAAQPHADGRGLALGLAAIAALGLLLREADEDEDEERDTREPRQRTLPARCLVTWRTPDGAATLHDPDCLESRVRDIDRLPLACAVTVRSDGRFISGFSPACLRERGWRTLH